MDILEKARHSRVKYPKILTVTCVTCGDTTEVLLKCVTEYRRRFYCSEVCEQKYLSKARSNALASRHGRVKTDYKPLQSRILAERPAACSSPKKRWQGSAAAEKAAREEARRQRDLEYWSALRRAKGIGLSAAE